MLTSGDVASYPETLAAAHTHDADCISAQEALYSRFVTQADESTCQPNDAVPSGFLRVTTDDSEQFPVAVERREGDTLLVRRLEDGEQPVPVTLDGEIRNVVLVTPVRYVSITITPEVGRTDDLLTWMRVVEKHREGNHVFGRTLAPHEPDTGEAILLKPGDQLTFEPGDIVVSLASIDAVESTGYAGYAPVAGVLAAAVHVR